uniref:Protein Ycf2-like n=1 Tax=Cucumis melo TaxID=3656 RepID=A0A9I9EKS4_CUCME
MKKVQKEPQHMKLHQAKRSLKKRRQNHKMLDDKEKFRNYPWGRLCFSLTKQFIQNAVKSKRMSKNSKTESKAYTFLQGFPMVLAYWAYKILSQLASGYVTRIGKECPRILNWESSVQLDCQDLEDNIFLEKNLSVVPIIALEEEMKSEYFRYFLELENDRLDEEACAMKNKNMAERISSLHEDIKDLKKQHNEDLDCLKKGQEEIVRLLLSLKEVLNQRLSQKCESEKQSQEPLEKNPPPSISLEMIDADVDKEKEIEDNEKTKEDDNHRENKSKMVHDTSNKVKVVQEKEKVKIMEIATNIENARPKRQPKP